VYVETKKSNPLVLSRSTRIGIEIVFEIVQCPSVVACNKLVIHMNREHEELVPTAPEVQAWVGVGRIETLGLEPFVKRLVETAR
jgi:hypothetical protein